MLWVDIDEHRYGTEQHNGSQYQALPGRQVEVVERSEADEDLGRHSSKTENLTGARIRQRDHTAQECDNRRHRKDGAGSIPQYDELAASDTRCVDLCMGQAGNSQNRGQRDQRRRECAEG